MKKVSLGFFLKYIRFFKVMILEDRVRVWVRLEKNFKIIVKIEEGKF